MMDKKGKIGIGLRFDLDETIEELEAMLSVCKRLRDKRHGTRRCCKNCESLGNVDVYSCPQCCCVVEKDTKCPHCGYDGHETKINYLCKNTKVNKLLTEPLEFEIDADIRTFVCPKFQFRKDPITNEKN